MFSKARARVVPAARAAWSISCNVMLRASPWLSSGLPQSQFKHILVSLSIYLELRAFPHAKAQLARLRATSQRRHLVLSRTSIGRKCHESVMSIVMRSGRKDCSRLLIDIQCLLDDGEKGMKGKRFGDNLEGLLRKPCGSVGISTDDNDGKRQIRSLLF